MPKLHQQLRRLCSWVRKKYRMLAYRRSMSLTGKVGVSTSLPVAVVMVVAAVAAVVMAVVVGVIWVEDVTWVDATLVAVVVVVVAAAAAVVFAFRGNAATSVSFRAKRTSH